MLNKPYTVTIQIQIGRQVIKWVRRCSIYRDQRSDHACHLLKSCNVYIKWAIDTIISITHAHFGQIN